MIGLFAVTRAGRAAAGVLAKRWGERAVLAGGPIRAELERRWPELDGAVCFLATGATVRLVADLLTGKDTDPGIVCVDEARRFAVALAGGHAGGANELAEAVAGVLGCTPVVTTASDAAGATSLDELVAETGSVVDGDLAGCGAAILDGEPVRLRNPLGFPLPPLPGNVRSDADGEWTVLVDDRIPGEQPPGKLLRLVPRTLAVGIGSARGVSRDAVLDCLDTALAAHGLDRRAVRCFATVELKADEAGILETVAQHRAEYGAPGGELATYPAAALAAVEVANPSEAVAREVGTPSVAEAAALLAGREHGGAGGVELAVPKHKGGNVTVAAARMLPRGRLAVVGLGPGSDAGRTPAATEALRRSSVVVGLDSYLDQVRHVLRPGTRTESSGLGDEERRAAHAVELARSGHAVALVGSGDAGVYAMGSPALQYAGEDVEVVGVPGVTAALSAASLLGAPLGHDHALISLSDLHTPWEVIERRVRAAAESDMVVCFYNPRSVRRDGQLPAALRILAQHRPRGTPVGAVRQAGRDGQRMWSAPLHEFDPSDVDMLTTVIVGSSTTTTVAGRMVTPRGYRWMEPN